MRWRHSVQIFTPRITKGIRLPFAFLEIELRPDWKGLRMLFQTFQPQLLGGKDVRQELKRTSVTTGTHCREHFAVRPQVIGELAPQIVDQFHGCQCYREKMAQANRSH